MKLPRLRLSETIILVVYAALIGNAIVASFVTPDSPAPVQVSPSIYVTNFKIGPPGLIAEYGLVDADGTYRFINWVGQDD